MNQMTENQLTHSEPETFGGPWKFGASFPLFPVGNLALYIILQYD